MIYILGSSGIDSSYPKSTVTSLALFGFEFWATTKNNECCFAVMKARKGMKIAINNKQKKLTITDRIGLLRQRINGADLVFEQNKGCRSNAGLNLNSQGSHADAGSLIPWDFQ